MMFENEEDTNGNGILSNYIGKDREGTPLG